jgi:hypothetical protein
MMIFLRDSTPARVKDWVRSLEEAGVQRVMLNWSRFDDIQGITAVARTLDL